MHGTSPSKYKLLGQRQDSHGCVRVRQDAAYVMYENLINSGLYWAQQLPDLNRRQRLKAENGRSRAGVRALIVLFYGYEQKLAQLSL